MNRERIPWDPNHPPTPPLNGEYTETKNYEKASVFLRSKEKPEYWRLRIEKQMVTSLLNVLNIIYFGES